MDLESISFEEFQNQFESSLNVKIHVCTTEIAQLRKYSEKNYRMLSL
jgi:hypothetical protein